MGTTGDKAVDRRAAGIQAEYKRTRQWVCRRVLRAPRRLAELPLITLWWGAYGEGSSGVHLLVILLAPCRVWNKHASPLEYGGQGSGLASRRRECQRREEMEMQHSREADYLVHCTDREIVRKGILWGCFVRGHTILPHTRALITGPKIVPLPHGTSWEALDDQLAIHPCLNISLNV